MLIVRSLERAERIVGAMRCRGFRGEFPSSRNFAFGGHDALVAGAGFAAIVILLAMELAHRGTLP
jgi:cobalt/nickel transport system permease protein